MSDAVRKEIIEALKLIEGLKRKLHALLNSKT